MRMRPARIRAAVILLAVSFAIFGIARTTGAGWLIIILSGLGSIAVAAAVWPAVAIRPVQVSARHPRDATAGRPVTLQLAVHGGRSGVQVRLRRPSSEWFAADPPAEGPVSVTPTRRGVATSLEAEVRSAAPLGIVWWKKVVTVALEPPMEVGPPIVAVAMPVTIPAGSVGENRTRGRSGADTVRSLREYIPGDPIRMIHWPSTARHGDLVVKEMEGPESPRIVVIADLRSDDPSDTTSTRAADEADDAAARAAGLARTALAGGVPVVLVTVEETGPRVATVASPTDISRRLARAVIGPPPPGPFGAGLTEILVTTQSRSRAVAAAGVRA